MTIFQMAEKDYRARTPGKYAGSPVPRKYERGEGFIYLFIFYFFGTRILVSFRHECRMQQRSNLLVELWGNALTRNLYGYCHL